MCWTSTRKWTKEHQIIDHAKSSCEKTSEVLAHVYGLAAELQGQDADELDAKGSRVAEAAQELLTTAQLTAPTIHTSPCKNALLDSAQALSSALENVARVWSDACHPDHLAQGQVLDQHKKAADEEIEKLIAALKNLPVYEVPKEDPVKAKKRVQFATSLSNTRDAVEKAAMEIKTPPTRQLSTAEIASVKRSLADKLATLNAAIASLMAATQDPSNPNFEAAESSSAVIQQLIPQLVQDTKALSGSTDEKGRAELLDELRALCAGAVALSSGAGDGDATKTNKALAQYANAAGKLTFVYTPQTHAQENNEKVLDKTQAVGDKSSELLAVVQQLKKPGSGEELEGPRLRAQQAAQAFIATAQLTTPTLHATQCRMALHQAASELSRAVDELGNACGPQLGQSGLQRIAQQRKEFDKAVEELMRTMKDLEGDYQVEEKRRLKFMATQKVLDEAAREMDKPTKSVPLTPQQVKALQSSLSNELAALNAAIAALTSSTRDPTNVNHEVAESSAAVIRELVPQIVQDAKTFSGSVDQKSQAALLDELRTLCAAAKTLTAGYSDGNATKLNEAVDQYAKAAGRLSFICTPQNQVPEKQRKVLEKTQAVCDKSSELVAAVQQLKKPGASNAELEGPRLRAEQAAQSLLTTAQLISPSLVAAQCRSTLHQAASELSHAVDELGNSCGPQLGQAGLQRIAQHRKEFDKAVEELMRTMKELEGDTQKPTQEGEKRRLKFKTTQAALDKATAELNKAIRPSPLTPPQAKALQSSLSDRLATLNAAIAAIVSSTRDEKKPDYAAAVTATIKELIPDLVQDARILAGGMDKAGQDDLLKNLRALLDATKMLSSGEHEGKEQEVNDAVERFTKASEKLAYTINPSANYALQDQIIDLTKSTCLKTSELLANVYDLADQTQGSKGEELDAKGTKVADAAQDLLTTAEITVHTVTSPLCRSSCIAAVDALDSSTKALALAWQGAATQPKIKELETAKAKVDEEVAKLRKALELIRDSSGGNIGEDDEVESKAARMRFITSCALTEAAVEAAKKELDKPSGAPLPIAEAGRIQDSLARRLGELNAVVGSIVATPRDTKSLSSSKDPAARDEMLAQTRALCDATLRIGASAAHSPEEINKAVPQYLQASSKLHFVFNPKPDPRADQIMDACESTCIKTSELMGHVRALAAGVQSGKDLEETGHAVGDAARKLFTAAQLTANSASSPQCQAVIFDASHQVSSSLQQLESAIKSSCPPSSKQLRAGVEQAKNSQEAVESELERLRALLPAVKDGASRRPAVPVRSASLKRRGATASDATIDFMDEMRSALKNENAGSPVRRQSSTSARSEADRERRTHFGKCVEQAVQSICAAEDDLKKVRIRNYRVVIIISRRTATVGT
ncbi:uncharacterized protein [Choristoneura fumiferana]|uniref:uncharacterized protein n=1 Tax=Choristoneura fumiferana TaxID=7141 RepID=UPI003D155E1A